MTWLTVYREAAGWAVFICAACLAAFLAWCAADEAAWRRRQGVGDDTVNMVHGWASVDDEIRQWLRDGGHGD